MSSLPIGQVLCGDCLDVLRGWPVCGIMQVPPQRVNVRGQEQQMRPVTQPDCNTGISSRLAKLLSEVIKTSDGCWLWQGNITTDGYGRIFIHGKREKAHRAAYTHLVGEIPAGRCVCHRCDNPRCVNPEHLFLGTHEDNMRDMAAKQRGRSGQRPGEDNPLAKLTAMQVAEIRAELGITPQAALARRYGVSKQCVNNIAKGKSWNSQ